MNSIDGFCVCDEKGELNCNGYFNADEVVMLSRTQFNPHI